jgi:PKD repeat protein
MWTWMKGSSFVNAPSVYGIKGVEDPANTPSGRWAHGRWKDLNGNFWFFGGNQEATGEYCNDLWRFNPVTNNWTWMNGDNIGNQPGLYGTKCISTAETNPGSRMENRATWVDTQGNLWMMGGYINGDEYNDLWKYCMTTNQWVWIEGDSTTGSGGNWGLQGVSNPLNDPGSRMGSVAWSDASGKLFLFGGYLVSPGASINDLWVYAIDPSCNICSSNPVAVFTAPSNICPGTCIDFTNSSLNATSYIWNFPGGNPSVSADANPTGICYFNPGNYDVTLIAVNANGTDTLTLTNYISVYPHPSPQGIMQNGDTLIANQGATSYQWYYNGNLIAGATNYFYVATQSGDYNVVATDENDCEVEAVINDVIAAVTPLSSEEGSGVRLYPNPVTDKLVVRNTDLGPSLAISIYNVMGEKINLVVDRENRIIDCLPLSDGLYILEIESNNKIYRTKFVKQ